jgi:hypothetical protein
MTATRLTFEIVIGDSDTADSLRRGTLPQLSNAPAGGQLITPSIDDDAAKSASAGSRSAVVVGNHNTIVINVVNAEPRPKRRGD